MQSEMMSVDVRDGSSWKRESADMYFKRAAKLLQPSQNNSLIDQ